MPTRIRIVVKLPINFLAYMALIIPKSIPHWIEIIKAESPRVSDTGSAENKISFTVRLPYFNDGQDLHEEAH